MDGGFREDVGVQPVAEVDGVDVIAFQIRVPTACLLGASLLSRAPPQTGRGELT